MEKSIAHFCRKVSVDGDNYHVLITSNEAKKGKRGLIKVDIFGSDFGHVAGSGWAVKNPCDDWNPKLGIAIAVGRAIGKSFNAFHGGVSKEFRKKFIHRVTELYVK